MLVLDTDHLVELDRGSSQGVALQQKLEDAGDEVATTIISAEEQFRGWLAQIHRQRDPHEQIARRVGTPGQRTHPWNVPSPCGRTILLEGACEQWDFRAIRRNRTASRSKTCS